MWKARKGTGESFWKDGEERVRPSGRLPVRLLVFALAVSCLSGCATTKETSTGDLPSDARTLPSYVTNPQGRSPGFGSERTAGSLWNGNAGSLLQDTKAHNIGDTVTITVSEVSTGQNQADITTNKTHTISSTGQLNDLMLGGASILGGTSGLGYSVNTTNKLQGQNSTDRSNTITAVMTATVIDILPNGNMVIRGSRWTKVNEEYQQMVLEGVVRPADISRANTVLSQNIADARIFMSGKGPLTTANKPGWFSQFLSSLSPF